MNTKAHIEKLFADATKENSASLKQIDEILADLKKGLPLDQEKMNKLMEIGEAHDKTVKHLLDDIEDEIDPDEN